jgi:hypothetical protein
MLKRGKKPLSEEGQKKAKEVAEKEFSKGKDKKPKRLPKGQFDMSDTITVFYEEEGEIYAVTVKEERDARPFDIFS